MKFVKKFLAAALFAGALAGCSRSDDSTAAGAPETVSVELKEGSVSPDKRSLQAGKVTFKAKNTGTVAHELVILRTDLPVGTLKVVDKKVEEEEVGAVIGEIEEFPPNTEKEGTLDLPAGDYVLFCNIEEHYQNGMRAALTVGKPKKRAS